MLHLNGPKKTELFNFHKQKHMVNYMIHKKSGSRISALSKTSPSFWPMASATGLTSTLNAMVTLMHAPSISLKVYCVFCVIFTIIMLYKWVIEIYNNR